MHAICDFVTFYKADLNADMSNSGLFPVSLAKPPKAASDPLLSSNLVAADNKYWHNFFTAHKTSGR